MIRASKELTLTVLLLVLGVTMLPGIVGTTLGATVGGLPVVTSTEPSSLVLLGSGLLGFFFAAAIRRRIRK